MVGWTGQTAALLGLAFACIGGVFGLVGAARRSSHLLAAARRAAYAFAGAMLVANASMVVALLRHDFSLHYVAQVGSRSTPWLITLVSLWSALEGSILFWGLIIGGYAAAFARFERRGHPALAGYALGVVLAVAAFFAFLIAAPANPFTQVSPVLADGPGPNPLLQNHPLMIIHPPMLYLGYVGMTVPFGVAMAALLRGELGDAWLAVLRRWTLLPWTFLSVGIVLGAWWAYEVLGWGGYWAWDPVENASFLPWLVATAYLHATVVQQRRHIFRAWTLSLVMAAFMLTILGTFMTRSGVFNSVHSFTQSPIGPLFLGFLAVVMVASFTLLAGRAHLLEDDGYIRHVVCRESAFMLNNVLLLVFTFTVLLGTIFPLVHEAWRGQKLSVGEPYFDRMAGPIGLALVFLMGVGPVLPWGKPQLSTVWRQLAGPILAGFAVVAACWARGLTGGMALLTFGLCGFAATATAGELVRPMLHRARAHPGGTWRGLGRAMGQGRRRTGGYIVHLAVILIVAAVAGSRSYKVSTEASLAPGQQASIGPYTVQFVRAEGRAEGQRFAVIAHMRVSRGGRVLGGMQPRLNFYPSQREPVGTPHVATLGHTDLYLSLMSVEQDGRRIALRAFIIPMVPWLWRSLPLIVLGTGMSMWPRRRRGADGGRRAAGRLPAANAWAGAP